MPSAIGATSPSFTSISNPFAVSAGSVEIVACGSDIGKLVGAIFLFICPRINEILGFCLRQLSFKF